MAKDQEREDDAEIEKVASTIKTDEEKLDTIMKDIKTEKFDEKKEVKREMSQLQSGAFDSLLSNGGTAYPEAKEKPQPAPKHQQEPTALTKVAHTLVAQSLGNSIKP